MDGTAEAVLWYYSYPKNSMIVVPMEVRNTIQTRSGTHVEYYLLNNFTDGIDELKMYLIDDSKEEYRTSLLDKKISIVVNGEIVVPTPYAEGNVLPLDNGKIIVTDKPLPPDECGIALCVYGRDVILLDINNDFNIDAPPELKEKITGYIKDSSLKQILSLTKEDIQKRKKGTSDIWRKFYTFHREKIISFLKKEGYLSDFKVKGEKQIELELNRDIQYLLRKNPTAKNIIDSLSTVIEKPVAPGKKEGSTTGTPAETEIRFGEGIIKGVIIFGEESNSRGFNASTPVEYFFTKDPKYLDDSEKATIHVYKAIANQPYIRLTPDITINGHEFTIENVPFDTPLLVTANTVFGNPSHTSPILGRPHSLITLSKNHSIEYVVLPIGTLKPGISIRGEDKYLKGTEYGILETKDDGATTIIYDTAHPYYKYCEKKGHDAKYGFIINAFLYVLSRQVGEKADDTYNELLRTINRR
jgi:hypothetical protein